MGTALAIVGAFVAGVALGWFASELRHPAEGYPADGPGPVDKLEAVQQAWDRGYALGNLRGRAEGIQAAMGQRKGAVEGDAVDPLWAERNA